MDATSDECCILFSSVHVLNQAINQGTPWAESAIAVPAKVVEWREVIQEEIEHIEHMAKTEVNQG